MDTMHKRSCTPVTRTRIAASAAVLLLMAGTAHADQFAYVTVQQAVQGMAAIDGSPQIMSFCAPCGDRASKAVPVRQVGIARIWDGDSARPWRDGNSAGYWEVQVNDAGIDLAYVYVRKGNAWQNLALLMGLPASGVPKQLSPAQMAR